MRAPSAVESASFATLALHHLQGRAQAAQRVPELGFSIANETVALVPYRQAALLLSSANGRLSLTTASGLTHVGADSPFAVWLEQFAQRLPSEAGCHRVDLADAEPDQAEGWSEWLPEHLLVCTLSGPDGVRMGSALYARDEPWTDADVAAMGNLHVTYGYCLWALNRRDGAVASVWRRLAPGASARWALVASLVLLFVPIRQTALAPAEVSALSARTVAAPQDGVIGSVAVQPHQAVKAGDLLFSLDRSVLASRRDVAHQALAVARADALVAQQRAFDDPRSKADVAAAAGRVKEKEAELAAIDTQADRVEVRAERDGVAIFSDANEWLGRPVQVGERVMQLADPKDAGIVVWLPANDAITLAAGARLKMFLHSQPLAPIEATLQQTSYQAQPGPDGVVAFQLRAGLDAGEPLPHIGLRGTARIAGEWTPLGLYVLRRPIAALRIWTGL
jgi:phosphotransferase system IIA component